MSPKNDGPIPQARERLKRLQVGVQQGTITDYQVIANTLHSIEKMLYRKPPVRVAPRKTSKVTKDRVEYVKMKAKQMPDASMMELAHYAGLNSGRVSEILNGKYDYLLRD
ncbi:hypothetical protein CPT_Percy14 [Caulobacter phage Percy]|uniref:Uncharacterized protein n=1 Tax=Caulobacter phage Percy TaxID=1701809 RepID=A0A0M5M185_9CAUD|nr:hypothetical protein CPT_Percy14 [Caulobacter phage Percy]ALF01648.1 hypothetical protein CPT_Percy14 [Caulobacter phage Percy]